MQGSTRFRLVFGQTQQYGLLTFPTSLKLTEAAADVGERQRGCAMGGASGNNMVDADGTNFFGFLMQNVNLYGTTGDTGFKEFSLGYPDISTKRGAKVSLIIPELWSIWELEGPASQASSIDHFLLTTGTGAITAATAADVLLSLDAKGSWRVAQTGDIAYAKMLKSDVTPLNATEIRIRMQFAPAAVVPA